MSQALTNNQGYVYDPGKPGVKLMPNHSHGGARNYGTRGNGGDHGLHEWGTVRQLTAQNARFRKGWMRNQPCHCESGKKFKKCCWNSYDK